MAGKPKRARRLISRTDLARMAGVSQTAITKQCKRTLAAALVGDRIDLDHPAVQAYLAAHGRSDAAPPVTTKPTTRTARAPTTGAKRARAGTAAPPPPTTSPVDERRQELDGLEVANARARLRERELRNAEAEGRLIPKEPIRAHIFGAISTLYKRLLEDVPNTLASRLLSAGRSGATHEEGKAVVIEVLRGQLEAVKAVATETLRDDE